MWCMGIRERWRILLIDFFQNYFPAANWASIRTTDPIKSAFATVRLRSKQARNSGSLFSMHFNPSVCDDECLNRS
ncbi:hypothetical protein EWM60_05965 [Candidatus Erwinia dacicola]|nr:hypothetical protein [Candidatus Erwinia dacicola]NJD85178.1 hypothetical protein [Candidatus Erwinia dacicola]